MTDNNNSNKFAISTTTTISSTNIPSSGNKLILNYKNHPSYILFISSLKSDYTKIKYDVCLQKYLKHSFNKDSVPLSDILSKEPKIIKSLA